MCDTPPNRTDHESKPPAHTFYFDIGLGGKLPHTTGVFFPDKYVAGSQLDLILYLAGIDVGQSIKDYWDQKSYSIRESVNDSERPFLLVAPTVSVQGKPGAKYTTVGELAKHPEQYLQQVICGISQEDPCKKGWQKTHPSPGKIIVAGHSGGGFDLPRLALAIAASKLGHLCECWGFDCLYFSNLDDWVTLAKTGVRLYIYYLKKKVVTDGKVTYPDTTTSVHAADLQNSTAKLRNVTFIELREPGGEHYWIPAKHLA